MNPKLLKIFLVIFTVLTVGMIAIKTVRTIGKAFAGKPEPESPAITLKTKTIAESKYGVYFDLSPDRRYVYYETPDASSGTRAPTQHSVYAYETGTGKTTKLHSWDSTGTTKSMFESFTDGNTYYFTEKTMLVLKDGKITATYPRERTGFMYVDYNDGNENACREYAQKATSILELGVRLHLRRPLYVFLFPDGSGVFANRFFCTSDYPEKRPSTYASLQSLIGSKRISRDYVFRYPKEDKPLTDTFTTSAGTSILESDLKLYGICFDSCSEVEWITLNDRFIKFYDEVTPSASNSFLGADGKAYMAVGGNLIAVY